MVVGAALVKLAASRSMVEDATLPERWLSGIGSHSALDSDSSEGREKSKDSERDKLCAGVESECVANRSVSQDRATAMQACDKAVRDANCSRAAKGQEPVSSRFQRYEWEMGGKRSELPPMTVSSGSEPILC